MLHQNQHLFGHINTNCSDSIETGSEETSSRLMNNFLFCIINQYRYPSLDIFMNVGTVLGNFFNMFWVLPLFLVAGLFFPMRKIAIPGFRKIQISEIVFLLLVGYIITGILVTVLKFGLHMPRPSVVFGSYVVHSWEIPDSPYSFPSGQSAFAMLIAATFWMRTNKIMLKAILLIYIVWVGLSRINLGMHFPFDVVSGFAIGAFSAWLANNVLFSLKKRYL